MDAHHFKIPSIYSNRARSSQSGTYHAWKHVFKRTRSMNRTPLMLDSKTPMHAAFHFQNRSTYVIRTKIIVLMHAPLYAGPPKSMPLKAIYSFLPSKWKKNTLAPPPSPPALIALISLPLALDHLSMFP